MLHPFRSEVGLRILLRSRPPTLLVSSHCHTLLVHDRHFTMSFIRTLVLSQVYALVREKHENAIGPSTYPHGSSPLILLFHLCPKTCVDINYLIL